MSTREVHILEQLAYLSRITAAKSKSGAAYCYPGRAWLAHQLGVSISTVSRYTSHLAALGVLKKIQRRRHLGKWQTNVYTLVNRAAWLVARPLQRLRRPPSGVAETQHKPPPEGVDDRSPDQRKALRAVLNHLERKLRGS